MGRKGAVVTKSVKAGAVVMGNPAREKNDASQIMRKREVSDREWSVNVYEQGVCGAGV